MLNFLPRQLSFLSRCQYVILILKWDSLSYHQFYIIQQKSPLSSLTPIPRLCFFPPKMKGNIYGHLNDPIFLSAVSEG